MNRQPRTSPICRQVDPHDVALRNQPLWCVFGPESFPTLFCCVIRENVGAPVIWGYSVYRRKPGFRTLGQELDAWLAERKGDNPLFFASLSEALLILAVMVSPRVKP